MKPRILVVSLGGTWMMTRHPVTQVLKPLPLGDDYNFLRDFPDVGDVCVPTFSEPFKPLDSTNIIPADWTRTAEFIAKHRGQFDGFVVLMGTDTLAFMSAALAFALQDFGKPVVVTGAQISRKEQGSDAFHNVFNACRLASLRNESEDEVSLPEVAVVFGSRIIRATRCRKYSECDLEAFDTINTPLLGRIQQRPKVRESLLLRRRGTRSRARFRIASSFEANVALLHIYPGMRPRVLDYIGERSEGLVLAAFGAGNIPTIELPWRGKHLSSIERVISRLVRKREKPIVITTQCVLGQVEKPEYEGGQAARNAGAILANDLTPECALVKLAWLLKNKDRWPHRAKKALEGPPGLVGGIRKAMVHPFVGEMNANKWLDKECHYVP